MARRRTVRDFSTRTVPRAVIERCLQTAGSAPNGANLQPWHFVAVSDPALKREIRLAAEAEEKEFYEHRAPNEWLEALAALGTMQKPFSRSPPADRDFLSTLSNSARRPSLETLLRCRIRWHRHWLSRCSRPPGRTRLANAYAKPDGVLEQTSPSPRARETFSPSRRRSPGRKRDGAQHQAQAARRHQLVYLSLGTKLPAPFPL